MIAAADDLCHVGGDLGISVLSGPTPITVGGDQAVLALVFQVEQSTACAERCTLQWLSAIKYPGAEELFDSFLDLGDGRAAIWPLPPAGLYQVRALRVCPSGTWAGQPSRVGRDLSARTFGRALTRWPGEN